MKRLEHILIVIVTILLLNLIYCIAIIPIVKRKVPMQPSFYLYVEYVSVESKLQADLSRVDYKYDKTQLTSLIEDETNVKVYLNITANLKRGLGLTIIPYGIVIIKENLNSYDYAITLTHELLHLKKFAIQEDYICFETFKLLYESKTEILHNYGVLYGITQLYGQYNSEYLCTDQIIEYMLEKGDK